MCRLIKKYSLVLYVCQVKNLVRKVLCSEVYIYRLFREFMITGYKQLISIFYSCEGVHWTPPGPLPFSYISYKKKLSYIHLLNESKLVSSKIIFLGEKYSKVFGIGDILTVPISFSSAHKKTENMRINLKNC